MNTTSNAPIKRSHSTCLVDNGLIHFPEFNEWNDPNYLTVLPNSVTLEASAGRQVEGFLDVSHFAFVHLKTFGESNNPEVPSYPVELTPAGFRADYISAVSNYPRTSNISIRLASNGGDCLKSGCRSRRN